MIVNLLSKPPSQICSMWPVLNLLVKKVPYINPEGTLNTNTCLQNTQYRLPRTLHQDSFSPRNSLNICKSSNMLKQWQGRSIGKQHLSFNLIILAIFLTFLPGPSCPPCLSLQRCPAPPHWETLGSCPMDACMSKLHQNNYKYRDGNAVYSPYTLCDIFHWPPF